MPAEQLSLAPKPRKAVLALPEGRTGLNVYGGVVTEEWLHELRGPKAVTVYREMSDNEPVVNALLFMITMLIRDVKWTAVSETEVEEGENNPDAEILQFVEECRDDMEDSWEDFMDEALSMLTYGWAYHELTYKLRRGPNRNPDLSSRFNDGRIGWRSAPLRGQETLWKWEYENEDSTGRLLGMWQSAWLSAPKVLIPLERAVHFRTSKYKANPEGRSILRGAYRPWFFKRQIEKIEAIGIERDLVGLPVLQVPPDILMPNAPDEFKTLKSHLIEFMKSIRRDEQDGILVPNEAAGYKFELMSSGGSRTIDITPVLERKAREISMAALADFMMLGHEQTGTFALSVSKIGLFANAINGWLEAMEEVVNRQMVWPLLEINNMHPASPVRLMPGNVQVRDITEKIEALSKLAAAGGMPRMPLRILNRVLTELDLPEIEEEEFNDQQSLLDLTELPPGVPGGPPLPPEKGEKPGVEKAKKRKRRRRPAY